MDERIAERERGRAAAPEDGEGGIDISDSGGDLVIGDEGGLEDDVSGEALAPKRMHDPKLPSEQEVKAHLVNHLPYRSWCPHCVRGRGRESDHRRRDGNEGGIPEYHMDYCFPGDEYGHRLTILVVVEKHTRMKKAVVVPAKGSTGMYAARMVLELMDECGDKNRPVIVKTDQEPAIQYLVEDVAQARTGAQTVKELAPKGSKGSNGVVERAVQSIEQYIRTLKSAMDQRFGVKVDVQHPVLTWLVEYSGFVLNRLEISADGRSAYERVKGKRGLVAELEFGEKILWKHPVRKEAMEKLNPRWSYGIFLGIRAKSGEVVLADEKTRAVKYTRTVRRVPESQRWATEQLSWVTAVPWNRGPGDDHADGELPAFDVSTSPGRQLTEEEQQEIASNEKGAKIVHRAHLRKADFEKFGFTDRCPGCSAILRGLRVQPHSQQCRDRMETALETDIRVKNAKARLQDRGRKLDTGTGADWTEIKRRRLQDIEERAMVEQDSEKLTELFDQYKTEYLKAREPEDDDKKRRRLDELEQMAMQEQDQDKLKDLYGKYMQEYLGEQGPDRMDDSEPKEDRRSVDDKCVTDEPDKKRRLTVRDALNLFAVANVSKVEAVDDLHEEGNFSEYLHEQPNIEDPWSYDGEVAYDDTTGRELPIELVRAARREEMQHMKNRTFRVVKREEAFRVTGRAPISTKWVDVDKSHGTGEMLVRSRWVARDFKDKADRDREDLFSATPPLELMRYAISRQATRRSDGRERKTMYLDVKKAHLIPKCEVDVYVDLPAEAEVGSDECGKLIYWLYGCRQAAQAWEEHYSQLLSDNGFRRLLASPVAFVHSTRDLVGVVHGDDFVFVGPDEDLDFVLSLMNREYEIKNRGRLGSGSRDKQEIDILGRRVRWHRWGLTWEGDPRHKQMILEYFGMNSDSNGLTKNGYRELGNVQREKSQGQDHPPRGAAQGDSEDQQLTKAELKEFRMLAARLNYMAQDNPAIQFPAKEICRKMSCPSTGDFAKIKQTARFLVNLCAVQFRYVFQDEQESLQIRLYADSDWAGCPTTRRSTSGGILLLGRHPLRTWSATQSVVAMSSAEAELYAMTEAAVRGQFMRSVLEELSPQRIVSMQLWTDSSAAKSFASTRGLGRMRHLQVKHLWVQQLVFAKALTLHKVCGELNPADVLTKYQDVAALERLLAAAGVEVVPIAKGGSGRGGVRNAPSLDGLVFAPRV